MGNRSLPKRLSGPALALIAVSMVLVAAGCGRAGTASSASGGAPLQVVAAENFWGSIAKQLAGSRARLRSIIVNPGSDPHSYQPTAADARALARASLVIVNGLGYDNWATQLLQASP